MPHLLVISLLAVMELITPELLATYGYKTPHASLQLASPLHRLPFSIVLRQYRPPPRLSSQTNIYPNLALAPFRRLRWPQLYALTLMPTPRCREDIITDKYGGVDPVTEFVWTKDTLLPHINDTSAGLFHFLKSGAINIAARYAIARQLRLPISIPITTANDGVHLDTCHEYVEQFLALRTVPAGDQSQSPAKILGRLRPSLTNEGLIPMIEDPDDPYTLVTDTDTVLAWDDACQAYASTLDISGLSLLETRVAIAIRQLALHLSEGMPVFTMMSFATDKEKTFHENLEAGDYGDADSIKKPQGATRNHYIRPSLMHASVAVYHDCHCLPLPYNPVHLVPVLRKTKDFVPNPDHFGLRSPSTDSGGQSRSRSPSRQARPKRSRRSPGRSAHRSRSTPSRPTVPHRPSTAEPIPFLTRFTGPLAQALSLLPLGTQYSVTGSTRARILLIMPAPAGSQLGHIPIERLLRTKCFILVVLKHKFAHHVDVEHAHAIKDDVDWTRTRTGLKIAFAARDPDASYQYGPHEPLRSQRSDSTAWLSASLSRFFSVDPALKRSFRSHFTAANLNLYPPGFSGPWHDDNDGDHISDYIASISFGLSAWFYISTPQADPETVSVLVEHGDAMFFNRKHRHKAVVLPHPDPDAFRINITPRAWNDSGRPHDIWDDFQDPWECLPYPIRSARNNRNRQTERSTHSSRREQTKRSAHSSRREHADSAHDSHRERIGRSAHSSRRKHTESSSRSSRPQPPADDTANRNNLSTSTSHIRRDASDHKRIKRRRAKVESTREPSPVKIERPNGNVTLLRRDDAPVTLSTRVQAPRLRVQKRHKPRDDPTLPRHDRDDKPDRELMDKPLPRARKQHRVHAERPERLHALGDIPATELKDKPPPKPSNRRRVQLVDLDPVTEKRGPRLPAKVETRHPSLRAPTADRRLERAQRRSRRAAGVDSKLPPPKTPKADRHPYPSNRQARRAPHARGNSKRPSTKAPKTAVKLSPLYKPPPPRMPPRMTATNDNRWGLTRHHMNNFYLNQNIYNRYHSYTPLSPALQAYLATKDTVGYVSTYQEFENVLLSKQRSWLRTSEFQRHIDEHLETFRETMERNHTITPGLPDVLSPYLGSDVANLTTQLHETAGEFIEFQEDLSLLSNADAGLIVDNNREQRFLNDRAQYIANYCDTLLPGTQVADWTWHAMLSKINLIHTSRVIPAPAFTMEEFILWVRAGVHNTTPRWAYWFYNQDGTLRTDSPSIRGNDPFTWYEKWSAIIEKHSKRKWKKASHELDIEEGDARPLP